MAEPLSIFAVMAPEELQINQLDRCMVGYSVFCTVRCLRQLCAPLQVPVVIGKVGPSRFGAPTTKMLGEVRGQRDQAENAPRQQY